MVPAFTIRSASADDAEGILGCLRSAFDAYRESYTPAAFADTVLTPETVRGRLESMSIWVATDEAGEVVGTLALRMINATHGHLRGMGVRPEWQGKGVADALLATIEEELTRRGCTRVTLNTTAPLERATGFYRRHGFAATGQTKDYFGMPLTEWLKEG
jgi:N-acetylglutamate synthase-like GNAT family acetyltransferase